MLKDLKHVIVKGPVPAPLERAETYYRFQITLQTQRMSQLSEQLTRLLAALVLPEDVTLAVDIDPVDLS